MSQPKWKLLWSTDYSAVFVDETGVYEPEMEIAQEYERKGKPRFQLYRFPLDKQKAVRRNGRVYIVPAKWDETWSHPIHQYEEWFIADLADVASFIDGTEDDLIEGLISDDVNDRAAAYESIGGYHGFDNLDQYPHDLSEREFDRRKSNE